MSGSSDDVAQRRPEPPRWVQWLFALPVAALIGQGALDYVGLGEPYPALIMPGFGGTRTDGDGIIHATTLEIEVHFVDSPQVERPTVPAFFRLPGSIVGVAAGNVFRHRRADKGAPRSAMKYRLRDTLMPSRARRAARLANGNQPTQGLIDWTRRRIAALYPGRAPRAVIVNWFDARYRVRDRSLEYDGQVPLDSFEVPLQ